MTTGVRSLPRESSRRRPTAVVSGQAREGLGPGGFRSAVAYARGSTKPVLIAVGPTGSDLSTDGGTNWTSLGKSGFHAVGSAGSAADWFAAGEGGTIGRLTGRLDLH